MVEQKLKTIQQKLSVPKLQHNDFGDFNYRSLEDILEAVKPLLDDLNLVLTLTDEIVPIGERYYIKATARLTDLDDNSSILGQAWAREPLSKKGNDESQITGAASTYARKYALNGLFCLDDTRDPDSMDNSSEKSSRSQSSGKQRQSRASSKDINRVNGEELIGKAEIENIKEKLTRYSCVGATEAKLLKNYKIKSLEEMSPDMYKHCMGVFDKAYEPKLQELMKETDDAGDSELPWN